MRCANCGRSVPDGLKPPVRRNCIDGVHNECEFGEESSCPNLRDSTGGSVRVFGCGCGSEKRNGIFTTVFECALHGKCAPLPRKGKLADDVEGVTLCHSCPDNPQLNNTVYLTDTIAANQHSGLGDRIESALTAAGITKERWKAFKGAMGLPRTCNCDARKEYINKLGEQLGEAAKSAVDALFKPVPFSKPTLDLTANKPDAFAAGPE